MSLSRGALAALLIGSLAALGARSLGSGKVRLEVGAFEGGLLGSGWSRSDRADIDPQATSDGRTSFYYRASPANSTLHLPLRAGPGPVRLIIRGTARVRSGVSLFASGGRAPEVLVRPGIWDRHVLEIPASERREDALELKIALRPLPLVRGAHVEDPRLHVDYFEIEAPLGLRLSLAALCLVAVVPPAFFAFAQLAGFSTRAALLAALLSGAATAALVRIAPFSTLAAIPRLLPMAFLSGVLAQRALLLQRDVAARERGWLASLVAAGVVFHGSLAFFPDHNPPDIDIHVRRTLDLASVPADYHALLRYGSHLPTASQDHGSATATLGERVLLPYSPLPYFFYYGLHLAGLDLYWAMSVLNAVLAMAVAPLVWLMARHVWNPGAAWLATLLYALDLAVWHHFGRSHAPAVFGGALGTAALLLLAFRADRLARTRDVVIIGAGLGVAALGYSSSVVLFGLFGIVLLALLLIDARGLTPAARKGVALALVVGGLLSGVLFYFHYVPGLLAGARSVDIEPDLFPGKTFFVFHNESRQSLRLWILGLWIPLLAGLFAAPLALRRAAPTARPFLIAWLAAWGAIMALKEPVFFPRLLRYAKEDQFVSPLLCLFVGGALAMPPKAWMRWAGALLVLAVALWLELRDFEHHANSLLL